MANFKFKPKNTSGYEVTVFAEPKKKQKEGIRKKSDCVSVGILIEHTGDAVHNLKGAAVDMYRYVSDTHDPGVALKEGLARVLRELEINKVGRTEIWEQVRENFPMGQYFVEYHHKCIRGL